MNMDTILHNYLTKLRIISKIPENGRLDTTQNDLNVYSSNLLNWMWRKFNGDSKELSAKYLMQFYREINSFSDQLMQNISLEQSSPQKIKKITMLVSLTEKIKESLVGIRNLIGTYRGYLKTVSILECLEHDIIISHYLILKKFIPEEYHTETIKSDLSQANPNAYSDLSLMI